jgi:hypothetical protein
MAQEYLWNRDFRFGDMGWSLKDTGWAIVNDPANAHTADWVARRTHDGGTTPAATMRSDDLVVVYPGDLIVGSAWFKSSAGANGVCRLSVTWLDSSQVTIGSAVGDAISPTTTYTLGNLLATTPLGASYAAVGVKVESHSAGLWYVDDVWIDPGITGTGGAAAASERGDLASLLELPGMLRRVVDDCAGLWMRGTEEWAAVSPVVNIMAFADRADLGTSGIDARPMFEAALENVPDGTVIEIPPGIYDFVTQESSLYVTLEERKRICFRGNAILRRAYTDPTQTLMFRLLECEDITFQGLTLDYNGGLGFGGISLVAQAPSKRVKFRAVKFIDSNPAALTTNTTDRYAIALGRCPIGTPRHEEIEVIGCHFLANFENDMGSVKGLRYRYNRHVGGYRAYCLGLPHYYVESTETVTEAIEDVDVSGNIFEDWNCNAAFSMILEPPLDADAVWRNVKVRDNWFISRTAVPSGGITARRAMAIGQIGGGDVETDVAMDQVEVEDNTLVWLNAGAPSVVGILWGPGQGPVQYYPKNSKLRNNLLIAVAPGASVPAIRVQGMESNVIDENHIRGAWDVGMVIAGGSNAATRSFVRRNTVAAVTTAYSLGNSVEPVDYVENKIIGSPTNRVSYSLGTLSTRYWFQDNDFEPPVQTLTAATQQIIPLAPVIRVEYTADLIMSAAAVIPDPRHLDQHLVIIFRDTDGGGHGITLPNSNNIRTAIARSLKFGSEEIATLVFSNATGIADWLLYGPIPGLSQYKGTATIPSGSNSIAVTHGLPYTPTAQEITFNLTAQPTADIGDTWLSAIGASTFTINCRNNPSTSGAVFAVGVKPIAT